MDMEGKLEELHEIENTSHYMHMSVFYMNIDRIPLLGTNWSLASHAMIKQF